MKVTLTLGPCFQRGTDTRFPITIGTTTEVIDRDWELEFGSSRAQHLRMECSQVTSRFSVIDLLTMEGISSGIAAELGLLLVGVNLTLGGTPAEYGREPVESQRPVAERTPRERNGSRWLADSTDYRCSAYRTHCRNQLEAVPTAAGWRHQMEHQGEKESLAENLPPTLPPRKCRRNSLGFRQALANRALRV